MNVERMLRPKRFAKQSHSRGVGPRPEKYQARTAKEQRCWWRRRPVCVFPRAAERDGFYPLLAAPWHFPGRRVVAIFFLRPACASSVASRAQVRRLGGALVLVP